MALSFHSRVSRSRTSVECNTMQIEPCDTHINAASVRELNHREEQERSLMRSLLFAEETNVCQRQTPAINNSQLNANATTLLQSTLIHIQNMFELPKQNVTFYYDYDSMPKRS